LNTLNEHKEAKDMCGCCEPVWPRERKTEELRTEKKTEDKQTTQKKPTPEPTLTR
jgi:hypothetical protein